jgi:hypothetical protein
MLTIERFAMQTEWLEVEEGQGRAVHGRWGRTAFLRGA